MSAALVRPPGSRHPWLACFARRLLALFGWRVRFDGLPGPRGVAIVYPHTSNWDFIIGLLAKWSIDLPIRWVGKETLFRGLTGATLGRLMRLWGGRPVDRTNQSGAVEQLAQLMQSEPWFWLGLSPEGTRRHTAYIRSGFYHLALKLDLPVALAYIDYRTREIGVAEFVHMSGDQARDLEVLRRFYADKVGRFPAKASTIAFRSSDTSQS
ncbi:MAG TPA: 1-acyl-sn-glycerol-3-phosphate acyltransferase [Burkholderiaceae bacterium]|nr:1-acyl-sn-glycerol-3-phosphate acyltransferase [Burkholderiaceae bacterium]